MRRNPQFNINGIFRWYILYDKTKPLYNQWPGRLFPYRNSFAKGIKCCCCAASKLSGLRDVSSKNKLLSAISTSALHCGCPFNTIVSCAAQVQTLITKHTHKISIRCIIDFNIFKINQTEQHCLKHLVNSHFFEGLVNFPSHNALNQKYCCSLTNPAVH